MNEKEKWETEIKLLFLIAIIIGLLVLYMGFRLVESNNEMTVWMLEHGRIK